jgi:uncharacterized Zn finger protein
MEQARLDQVVQALQKKNVNMPCPRCGSSRFSIVGETHIVMQQDPGAFVIGGPSIPTVIVACDHCGYITQHASVPLGLASGS